MIHAEPAAKRQCVTPGTDTRAAEAVVSDSAGVQASQRQPAAGPVPICEAVGSSLNGTAALSADHHSNNVAQPSVLPLTARGLRLVKLPGREVNVKRARLWKEHDTDSVLFDVKLLASDRDIHCNRFVLAEESSFFEEHFHSQEFAKGEGTIDLKHIDGSILLGIVGSLFTANIRLSNGNLDLVLHWAHTLKLSAVVAACTKYIQVCLCEGTVSHALWLARRYELNDLRAAVLQYVKSTFFLMHRTSLEGVDEQTLLQILSADDLVVFSEMQVYRAVAAWIEHHKASSSFDKLFKAVLRPQHMQPFEARSLLADAAVREHPAACTAITEAILNRLEGSRPLSQAPQRDKRRCVWAIDDWAEKRQQKTLRSPHFWLAGSERTWLLSYTSEKSGFHLTCVGEEDEDGEEIPYSPLSGQEAGEAVQLTMVLYHQSDYNRARRWRLPKCILTPGEYQGFDWFFKDVDAWVYNDRIVVGVQLRLVGSPDVPQDDTAASPLPMARPAAVPRSGHLARDMTPLASGAATAADGSDRDSSCT